MQNKTDGCCAARVSRRARRGEACWAARCTDYSRVTDVTKIAITAQQLMWTGAVFMTSLPHHDPLRRLRLLIQALLIYEFNNKYFPANK